jgi:hypothetical protein
VQVDIDVHSSSLGALSQIERIVQTVLAVVVARPDADSSKVSTIVGKDPLERLDVAIVSVPDTLVLEVDEGREVCTTVGNGVDARDQGEQPQKPGERCKLHGGSMKQRASQRVLDHFYSRDQRTTICVDWPAKSVG